MSNYILAATAVNFPFRCHVFIASLSPLSREQTVPGSSFHSGSEQQTVITVRTKPQGHTQSYTVQYALCLQAANV